ncbi:outer membrane protein assembly factor BamB family protein [Haladaptatus salinisoli]|uniref:outer membrane protein assembly factor BamB family protein n=1 Tax=Haladaptatus salinisoli TaxID=2884876 RepID=UPI001D0AE187|nr:PQQ-binding-like beta-propeller repeat protein [Haladaptatus salinisoli]
MGSPSNETRRTFLKLTGIAIGATGVTGTATSDASDPPHRNWSTFQHDAGNTGYSPVGGDSGSDTWVDWSVQLSDRRLYAPVVADGTVYVSDASGVLTAFDAETRETRWTAELRGQEYAPTVVGDTVYVSGADVFALSTADGSERWRFEVDGAETSPITVADGTLFFKTSDVNGQGTCWAVDAETGDERWHVGVPSGKEGSTPSAENVPPAVADGVAYFADNETVYALDARNGTPQWRADADGFIEHGPTVADGTVYVCGESVFALSASDGRTKWNAAVGESPNLTRSPAVTDESVVVADGRRARVWALAREDGTTRWTFDGGAGTAGTPTIAEAVYVPISGDDDGVVALDPATGDRRWRVPIRDLGGSWLPSAVGDALYVTDREGFLYALADPDWLDWRAEATGSLAVGENVYASDGTLVALEARTGAERWTVDGGASQTVGNGAVVGTDESAVVAYEPDGTERWRAECDEDVTTDPVVEGGRVFVGGDGWVSAFNLNTGGRFWTYRGNCDGLGTVDDLAAHGGRAFAVVDSRVVALGSHGAMWSAGGDVRTVAVDDGVYVGTAKNEVVAYDFGGNERWRAALDRGETVSSLVADGGVYAVTTSATSTGTGRREWLVSLDDGEVTWTFHPKFLPFGTLCAPVVADGTVYVGASDRRVYALSADDGTERRRFETGGEVESVAVGRRVYASSDAVYAFRE